MQLWFSLLFKKKKNLSFIIPALNTFCIQLCQYKRLHSKSSNPARFSFCCSPKNAEGSPHQEGFVMASKAKQASSSFPWELQQTRAAEGVASLGDETPMIQGTSLTLFAELYLMSSLAFYISLYSFAMYILTKDVAVMENAFFKSTK